MSAARDAYVARPRPNLGLRRRGIQVRLFALALLAFLAYPVVGLADRNRLLYLPLALFAAGYVRVVWRNTPDLHRNRAPVTLGLTHMAGALLLPSLGFDWLSGLAFFSSVMLLINFSLRWWPTIITAHSVTFVGAAAATGATLEGLTTMFFLVVITHAVQVSIYRQLEMSTQLQQARANLTQLALAEERLRIARDLHDILGQRLSAVALKAELAARLVTLDQARAAIEMTEVGAVARDALAEVRAAVSGYRKVSLAVEAQSAEALLKASGIVVTIQGTLQQLEEPFEQCAASLVREATTNTVRHSNARHCQITVTHDDKVVTVEIRDDGVGASLPRPPRYGTGLTGLAERVALANGELFIGPCDGWFVVRARLYRSSPRST
ncbi:MAG TPA: sensor histidine kinase [Micromonosporaceae bacterium]